MAKLITIEGGDGAGKSTIAKALCDYYQSLGKKVILTREPGGVDVSEKIRKLIFENEMSALTEAYLFIASREEHLEKKVIPALEEDDNTIIIMDRYFYSSLAYQGVARNITKKGLDPRQINIKGTKACEIADNEFNKIYELNKPVISKAIPDSVFILDISYEKAMERMDTREAEKNRLDKEPRLFHEAVREGFLKCEKYFSNVKVIDASRTTAEILEDIKALL